MKYPGIRGNTDASTTRSPCVPCTVKSLPKTPFAARGPIAHEHQSFLFGIPKGEGNTIRQFVHVLTHLGDTSGLTLVVGAAALALLFGAERLAPRLPGFLAVDDGDDPYHHQCRAHREDDPDRVHDPISTYIDSIPRRPRCHLLPHRR